MFGKCKLKAEIERLKKENNFLSDQIELKDSHIERLKGLIMSMESQMAALKEDKLHRPLIKDSEISEMRVLLLSICSKDKLIPEYEKVLSDCYIRGPKGRFVKYLKGPTPSFKVYDKDLIGDIEGFPKEVLELMLERQYEQTGKVDIGVFQKHRTYGLANMGFIWYKSKEGHYFWKCVICDKNFDVFFEKYPKKLK